MEDSCDRDDYSAIISFLQGYFGRHRFFVLRGAINTFIMIPNATYSHTYRIIYDSSPYLDDCTHTLLCPVGLGLLGKYTQL